MKRYVPGGAQEAVALLISLNMKEHVRFHFEYDDPGCDGIPTVRYEITELLLREVDDDDNK